MERLWTPWRLQYVTGQSGEVRKGVPEELSDWPADQDKQCVFCNMTAATDWAVGNGMKAEDAERAALILHRGTACFVCLNRFPYSTGHVMVVPYTHVAELANVPESAATEIMLTARRMESAIREAYHPDGLNLGMNIGEAAGAGIAQHLHLHELPRWKGDTNFMSVTADTRILPEQLETTWTKLRSALKKMQLERPL